MIATLIAPLLVAAGIAAAPTAAAHTPDCAQTGHTSMCQQQAGHPSIYTGYIGPGDGMQTGGGFGGFIGSPISPPVFPVN